VVKHIGRIVLAVLLTLALGVGLTAFAGSASARIRSTASCASEQSAVAHFQHKVHQDKRKLKAAKRHHHKFAAKKARKHLKRDRRHLAAAQSAYDRCTQGQASPAPAPSPAPASAQSNPVTDQCNAAAGQLTSQDPTGSLASGAAAFCDLLGQLAAASPGSDPVALCNQLAAQDPTGQLVQLCTALGGASLPGTGTGTVGGTLEGLCDQLAAQDPTGQLSQLCTGLGSLPF
jgi:hypothetical protein